MAKNAAVIVSMARTPIGRFMGELAPLTAPQLGSVAIEAAIERAGIAKEDVGEAFMGNVVSAGVGQAPARQAVLGAGLPLSVPCTTVNKVCASGTKSLMLAAQSIMLGAQEVVVAGGMESMSNIPHYLPGSRAGFKMGPATLVDGCVHDGLWDVYNNQHMGMCGEKCSEDYGISREAQDDYAVSSYERAQAAAAAGVFAGEIAPVTVPGRRGDTVVDRDGEVDSVDLEKLRALRPAFKRDGGCVTAANASSLNDGAAAMVVMSEQRAADMGLTPLARIIGFGDAARDPVEFTVAPSDAVPVALKTAGLSLADVDYHEINEAFSVVALVNMQLMGLDRERVNVNGGAVAMGHPIGMSGTRIVSALYTALKQNDATIGMASICNGGGGASALAIERLN